MEEKQDIEFVLISFFFYLVSLDLIVWTWMGVVQFLSLKQTKNKNILKATAFALFGQDHSNFCSIHQKLYGLKGNLLVILLSTHIMRNTGFSYSHIQ